MAMRQVKLRFPESLWKLIEQEAAIDGTSGSQFVRDATLLRIGFRHAERGDYSDASAKVQAILDAAREKG